MNKLSTLTLAALASTSLIAADADAATVLIDFGRTTNTTGGVYNDVTLASSSGSATTGDVALSNTGSAPTGWTINFTENGSGNGGPAGGGADVNSFPPAVSSFATTALQDSLFFNDGGGTNISAVITIDGLDNSKTYDLLFYGSRGNGQSANQTWTITKGSGGGGPVTHASGLNSTTVVDWNNVSTDGNNVIEFTITATGDGQAGAINFGQIIEVPEPSSLALLSLGGLLIARRRRG